MDPKEIRERYEQTHEEYKPDYGTDPEHPAVRWVCSADGCREAFDPPLETRHCPECGSLGFYPVNTPLFTGWKNNGTNDD